MPVDYYRGQSVQQLEALLARLVNAQATGRITEVSAAGVRTVKSFSGSEATTEILRVRYSLFMAAAANADAALIAKYPNPYLERIRRTRASYV